VKQNRKWWKANINKSCKTTFLFCHKLLCKLWASQVQASKMTHICKPKAICRLIKPTCHPFCQMGGVILQALLNSSPFSRRMVILLGLHGTKKYMYEFLFKISSVLCVIRAYGFSRIQWWPKIMRSKKLALSSLILQALHLALIPTWKYLNLVLNDHFKYTSIRRSLPSHI